MSFFFESAPLFHYTHTHKNEFICYKNFVGLVGFEPTTRRLIPHVRDAIELQASKKIGVEKGFHPNHKLLRYKNLLQLPNQITVAIDTDMADFIGNR